MNKKIAGLSLALILLGATASFAASARAEGAVVQSASGSGEFVTDSGLFRTFAFSALKYADGSVRGEAEVRNPEAGTLRHFQVDCLSIRGGNLAIASGIVTSAEDPALVGHPAIFAVQDNGQGAGSGPDQVSQGVYVDQPFTCETAPTPLALSVLVPIDTGNIQVQ
jgi:hypothetical protein